MQVFNGVTRSGATEEPQLSGSVQVLTAESPSAASTEYQETIRLGGLENGFSYAIHAVAQDMNHPSPNRMPTLCVAPEDGLVCAPVDRPCVKSLQVACECVGLQQAQVTVRVGTRGASSAAEGHLLHYMVLEAELPTTRAPIQLDDVPVADI